MIANYQELYINESFTVLPDRIKLNQNEGLLYNPMPIFNLDNEFNVWTIKKNMSEWKQAKVLTYSQNNY